MPRKRMGEWRYSSTIPDFTPRQLFSQGRSPRYSLHRWPDTPGSVCVLWKTKRKRIATADNQTPASQLVARSCMYWATSARVNAL
jgi:hypothetical protein